MTSPTPTRRATTQTANSEGRKSRSPSLGTLDQSLFWRDVKQAAVFVGGFVLAGALLALFFAQLQGAF